MNSIFPFVSSPRGWIVPLRLSQTLNWDAGILPTKSLVEIARILKVKVEDLREMDVRAPIDEIKRITQDDPTFALAFRTVIDKKISADELLEFVKKKEDAKKGKDKK